MNNTNKKSQLWLWGSVASAIVPWIGALWIRSVHQSYSIDELVRRTGMINGHVSQMSGKLVLVCVVCLIVAATALFFVKGKRKLIVVAALLSTIYVGYIALFSYTLLG